MKDFVKSLFSLFSYTLSVLALIAVIYVYVGYFNDNYIFDKVLTTTKIQTGTQKTISSKGHPPYHDRDALTSVKIEGTVEFHKNVTKALNILKEKAPTHYERIGKYVTSIEYTPKTKTGNTLAYVQPAKTSGRVFFVKLPSKNEYEINEYAAALIHESRHIEQYHASPEMFRDIGLVEHDAVRVEVEALNQIGAPQVYINSLIDLLKSKWWENEPHFDPPPQ